MNAALLNRRWQVLLRNSGARELEETEEGFTHTFVYPPREEVPNAEQEQARAWRLQIQRALLSRYLAIREADMPSMNALFSKLESEDLSAEQLTYSKLPKVLRYVYVQCNGRIPGNDEFQLRERAKALIEKWNAILDDHKKGAGHIVESVDEK